MPVVDLEGADFLVELVRILAVDGRAPELAGTVDDVDQARVGDNKTLDPVGDVKTAVAPIAVGRVCVRPLRGRRDVVVAPDFVQRIFAWLGSGGILRCRRDR